jgi:hypothetical protein
MMEVGRRNMNLKPETKKIYGRKTSMEKKL